MNTTATRIMLALSGGLLWAGSAMSANEMRFSDIEARIAAVEQKTSALPGLKSAAFLSDGDAIDAIAPNESMPEIGDDEEITSPVTSSSSSSSSFSSHSHTSACECGSTCDCGSAGDCDSGCGSTYECESGCGCGDACRPVDTSSYYADVQLMFMRPHLLEESVGKLSEKYELAPRFVVGYESDGGVGARIRYWSYGRATPILTDDEDIRFEFEVIDLEATSRFRTERSELVLGGGFRFANADIVYDDEAESIDMPGITFAADLRTTFCGDCRSEWSAVCGARVSLLGGDWEGSDDALIEPVRDDNVVAQELYAGVEYVQRYESCNMFARLVLEIQNWHSDALADSADADSLGFVGPGIHAGGTF